jgi:hypothetical protein
MSACYGKAYTVKCKVLPDTVMIRSAIRTKGDTFETDPETSVSLLN